MTEEDRISQIINRLEELTLESQILTRELHQLNLTKTTTVETTPLVPTHNETTPLSTTINETKFKVGDRVKITNKYRNQYGVIGVVTRVTAKQVILTDSSGQEYKRKLTNLKRV